MVVNNKYQIGQKVFFLDEGKAKCDVVKSITVFVRGAPGSPLLLPTLKKSWKK